jgi:hypothetical protein
MDVPQRRGTLAHLLHALNQPLTGLQCSLELAAASLRRAEDYDLTLRGALELTARMRILVEAIRELTEMQPPDAEASEEFDFDALLRDTVNDLLPVAESKNVDLQLVSEAPLRLCADRRYLSGLIFRWCEAALSLAESSLQITVTTEAVTSEPVTSKPTHARLIMTWNRGPSPEHSPFSRSELGLVISQAGWERAGAEVSGACAETQQSCTVRLPFVFPAAGLTRVDSGEMQ